MAFKNLTVRDGLSQNNVMDILQDSQGYIWLATENGLDRYDGYTFKRYQRGLASRGELASDYIWDIVEDKEQNLWLATAGGGLVRWHRKTDQFEHFRHNPLLENSLSSDRIRTLLATDEGVWIGTDGSGLNFYNPKTGSFTTYHNDPNSLNSLPSNEIFALLEDNQGRLWVGTNQGLAWLQPGGDRFTTLQHNEQNPLSLSNNRVRALFQDRHGGIWVGTFGGGLNLLDRRTGQFKRFRASQTPGSLSNDHVRTILEDDAGRLWVGTAQGLNVMHPYTDTFASYFRDETSESLRDDFIMSLHQDRGGVLWIGTRTAGVSAWNSQSWFFGHNNPDWLQQQSVTAFTSHEQYLWVGSFNAGLSQTNLTTNETIIIDKDHPHWPLPDNRVMSLLADHNGGLWIGTMEHGLVYKPAGGGKLQHFVADQENESNLSGNEIMSLFEASDGGIWIGTFSHGISRLDPKTRQFSNFAPAPASEVCGQQGRAFAEDAQHNLWIGTENGLCKLDVASGRFTTYRNDELDPTSISSNSIYALHLDAKKRLWVGTGDAGLNQVLQGGPHTDVQFRSFDRSTGLASNTIFGVVADGDGHLWLSSNNGLMRFDPNTHQTRIYQSTHGLQGNEFHYGASHKDANGRLYFGGANGYNAFDPSQIHSTNKQPSMVLTRVLKLNQPIQTNTPLSEFDALQLNYNENSVTFEFAALDFTEPENNRYRYKLEGFDETWVDAGNKRTATYTNLYAGAYTFRAIGASSDGVWNDRGLNIALTVQSPPWFTWWAYTLYALFAIGLIVYLWSAQQRKLARATHYRQRLEQEVIKRTEELAASNEALQLASEAKSEFVAHMSHEIRSPINGILGMSELLNRTQLGSKQRKFAQTIHSSTQSLLAIVNDILDFSKLGSRHMELDPVATDVEELINDVAGIFALQAQSKGIELVVQLPSHNLPELMVDPLRLRQVLINLVSNAVKFTDTGHVALTALVGRQKEGHMHIDFSVRDTGVGIAAADQLKIFDSFTQAEASTSRRFGGTGLGLSISRGLVSLMGGTLGLESQPEQGSCFAFALNLGIVKPLEAESIRLAASVLVVCREQILCEQLTTYLVGWGCKVSSARSAQEATALLTHEQPALIIIDPRVADLPGTALAQNICDQGADPGSIITLLPIHSSDEDTLGQVLNLPIQRRRLRQALEAGLAGVCPQHSSTDSNVTAIPQFSASVLLVEDNVVNQEVFIGMLNELGCQASIAIDGFSAIGLCREQRFDLILMDYRLPDINGTEVTKRIRKLEDQDDQVPIVALTANASAEDRKRCLDAGMNDFLAKPCPITRLAKALTTWLPDASPTINQAAQKNEAAQLTMQQPPSSADASAYDTDALARIRALKRADGTSMLLHAMDLFSKLSVECCEELQNALQNEDAETISFNAHKLKSACANLGLQSLSGLCRELEERAQQRDTQSTAVLIDKFIAGLPPAQTWLEQQVTEHV